MSTPTTTIPPPPTPTTTTPTAAQTTWEPFRVLLLTQRDDCLHQREVALAETVSSQPDLVAVTRAGVLLSRLEEIDAALDRISEGTYGSCGQCGRAIPIERLQLRPYADNCVACPRPVR
ncbi:TraR/DksA C4-type zinc finger protein [Modestobacter lapidis]|nr:conjugal transfer protein TraR [Modestobacter lapidis]